MKALRCENCGGAVAVQVGKPLPRCLFCGTEMTHLQPIDIAVQPPDRAAPLVLSQDDARARFQAWAKKSWMRPYKMDSAKVEVKPVYVPALRFSAEMKTRWTGKIRDRSTRSGKRPRWGIEHERINDAFVVTSEALTRAEIRALDHFRDDFIPADDRDLGIPREVGERSQRVAEVEGLDELKLRHEKILQERHALSDIRSSFTAEDIRSEHVLVPVYIGVFYLRDRSWRVLINGCTGEVVGETLRSRIKLALIGSVIALFLGGPCATMLLLGIFFPLYWAGIVDD
ncbi:MAG: hypothetical protein AAFV53_30885 [Myxococcota bacterium]